MVRKILNRRELRDEADAAERQGADHETETGGTVTAPAPKKPATRKSRPKAAAKEVRLKAYWGVFNQALNPVVMFEYNERDQAQQKAEELSQSRKSPHFVQLVKKVIDE